MIVLDCETTGLNPRKCKPTHVGTYMSGTFQKQSFDGCEIPHNWIGHNAKFDYHMIGWNSGKWEPWSQDTMLLSQLYDSRQRHSLDNLGKLYLGEGKFGDKKVLQAIKKGEFWMLSSDIQTEYLRRDCELTWRLYNFFKDELPSSLWNLYETFDHPVSIALAEIERNGININMNLLKEYKEKLENELRDITPELERNFKGVNLNSPTQLLATIKSISGITINDTSERTLQGLARYVSELSILLRYRVLTKYLKTYIGNLYEHEYKGKIYPQFHLAGDYHASKGRGTETGRTSSSNPNLQNQPRVSSGPVNIRSLFVSSPGSILLACDYSQLELKVAAYMSGESNLLKGDVHADAAEILGVPRQMGKTCNFALLYGAGKSKLKFSSGGSKHVEKYTRWFEETFPKATSWIQTQREKVEEEGRVSTYLGRVRYLADANAGPNSVIQGTAGDIGKEAALQVHKKGWKVLGLIHDEVMVEVPKENLDEAVNDIPNIMTSGLVHHKEIHDKCQLTASVKVGDNWGDMHEREEARAAKI